MKMKRWVAIMLVLVSIVSILPTSWGMTVETEAASANGIKIGDKITLGKYLGEPIVWVCVDIDENGPLMLSEKILFKMKRGSVANIATDPLGLRKTVIH